MFFENCSAFCKIVAFCAHETSSKINANEITVWPRSSGDRATAFRLLVGKCLANHQAPRRFIKPETRLRRGPQGQPFSQDARAAQSKTSRSIRAASLICSAQVTFLFAPFNALVRDLLLVICVDGI
jgi:hypothetical protein